MDYNNTNRKKFTMNTDISRELMRHLAVDKRTLTVSNEFRALETNSQRVQRIYELLDEYNLLPKLSEDPKSDQESIAYRTKGNDMFKQRNHQKALELYTISAVFAQNESEELGKAYANRSAVLFEQKLYKECLTDIERALDHNYPKNLMDKLVSRRERAQQLLATQTSVAFHDLIPEIKEKSDKIECASNAIEIKYTESQGRHVVATRDIKIGEIILVERAYSQILLEEPFTHCHECLTLCYTLIPCNKCTQAFYCGEMCKEIAFKSHHEYECAILKTTVDLKLDRTELFPMQIALKALQEGTVGEEPEDSAIYKSNRYYELDKLVGNTEKRSVSDLTGRSITAALVYHLIDRFSNFFERFDVRDEFKEAVLKQLQVAACNFHEVNELQGINLVQFGDGAYPVLSMFNHSCNPNVTRTNYGTTNVLYAIRTIKNGQQCYDNYGYHYALTPRETRRAKLEEQYYFKCECEACEKDWPLFNSMPMFGKCNWEYYYMQLMKGPDREKVKTYIPKILREMQSLEDPNKGVNSNFNSMQEVLKQCWNVLGSTKQPFT